MAQIKKNRTYWENIDRLISLDIAGRGFINILYPPTRERHGRPLCLLTAEKMQQNVDAGDIVLIACGMFVYPLEIAETDGPLGGAALARALQVGLVLSWFALRTTPNNIHPREERIHVTTILLRNRNARLLVAGYTFHCWELLGMWSWTPAFFAACLAISGKSLGETAKFVAYLVASMHLIGALASASMGRLEDQLGRRVVLIQIAMVGACVSLVIGWLNTWPIMLLVFIGLVYYFTAIGDSPVLSTALTEVVEPSFLGFVFAVRSLLGFGAGGVAPIVFGAVLDLTNPSSITTPVI